jgi:hypothetical protein
MHSEKLEGKRRNLEKTYAASPMATDAERFPRALEELAAHIVLRSGSQLLRDR